MKNAILKNLMIAGTLFGAGLAVAANNTTVPTSDAEIVKKLMHEIKMYPRYSIFDDIKFSVDEGRVTLLGEVSQPYKKSELEHIAQRVPGVTSLDNEIKVLPVSPMDSRLRRQVASAIYRDPVMTQYRMQAVPPIHIIVENGHVTLEGVVRTEMEKSVAGMRASGAGLGFGPVINNLQVENPSHRS